MQPRNRARMRAHEDAMVRSERERVAMMERVVSSDPLGAETAFKAMRQAAAKDSLGRLDWNSVRAELDVMGVEMGHGPGLLSPQTLSSAYGSAKATGKAIELYESKTTKSTGTTRNSDKAVTVYRWIGG